MLPKIHTLPKKERLPAGYWEDFYWALEPSTELSKKYAGMWIAIANKKVVAFGKELTDEKKEAISRELGRPIVTFFVSSLSTIYYE
ncbi:MAG: hypothetical protein IIA88_12145 [Bacteroidetes bacterium]|nr:hypothetical protein [Bacteroidota bacterium]